ncbi:MAG TPA: PAS domain-containing sensor histidine kinase [Acidisarcina sp.]
MRLSLERIVDFMPCGVLVVDRAGTILTVNPEALRLLDAAAPGLPQGAPRPGLNNIGAWGHLDLRSFYAEGAGDSQQEFCIGTANGGSPGADGSRWLEVRSRCLDAETTAAVKGSTLGRFEAGPPQRKPRNASQNIPNNLPPQHLTRNRLPSVAGNTSRPASAPPYGSGQIEEQRAEETATPAAAATSGRQTILILRDITAAKRMEADRERALRAMTLAEITTMLAHEIRNPLTSMELFAGLLAADRVSNPEWISHLRAGIRSLSGTVNNVLSFHGACAMTLSEVDLPAVVQASIDFVRPLADQSGISLEWLREASLKAPLSAAQGPCAGPGHEHATARRPWKKSETRIMGSESALQQVVLNLLTNAIRHTPRGGAVRVSMKIVGRQKNSRQHLEDSQKQRVPAPLRGASWPVPSPVHPVAVPGRRKFGRSLHPARVLLAFEDNGRGMPAEALSRIFEPGFSAGGDTPGLGLTVCKTILDQHGARISVTSRPGSGATFALEFPLI